MSGRHWTQQEKDYLADCWGTWSIATIARRLGRSVSAVRNQAWKMRLGGTYVASAYLGIKAVSQMLGVDRNTIVLYWIEKCGLKSTRRRIRKARKRFIKHRDLLLWLERNQDKWDSRRVEMYALGVEPGWLREKRQRDRDAPAAKGYTRWTAADRDRIRHYYQHGVAVEEIAKIVSRTPWGVYHQLRFMGVIRRER